ncbi:MAG: AAA family ATPase [Verrucomicrobia bacterium]|nr:AAA family ATPase [Verrucomicrobiota bacterium]
MKLIPQARLESLPIRTLRTGVRGLDEILGGGIPEFSFTVIAGQPGCGKTTLAHQIAFANATPEKPALYFSVLGESSLKMLRYQQQYSFFDASKIGTAIRLISLADVALTQNLDDVLQEIVKQVTAVKPAIVVVDSFRSLERMQADETPKTTLVSGLQRLSLFLSTWEATTILVGEYFEADNDHHAVFSLADGLIWLRQVAERNSVVRKLQVVKMRGRGTVPGLHTFRINENGIQTFSRTLGLLRGKAPYRHRGRISLGLPDLDRMLNGGVFEGDSILVAGPSGTGKSMQEILDAIEKIGAKRLVIDSLVGFEMALAPGFRADFRESLYRMIGALTGAGVTILSTVEVEDSFDALSFSRYAISFLTDDIIRMRYVEINGQLRKVIMVIKMRGGNHSKDIREYVISDTGLVILHPRETRYEKMSSGLPQQSAPREEASPETKANS